jgi:hypothetical protein
MTPKKILKSGPGHLKLNFIKPKENKTDAQGHRDTETDEKTLLELIMAMFQKNLQNPPIQKLLKTLSLHWLVNSSVIMVHSCQKCPIDKEGKGAIVPLNFFKSQSLIQVNLVISKFTGLLQNFELSEIRLKGSKGLHSIVNSVR